MLKKIILLLTFCLLYSNIDKGVDDVSSQNLLSSSIISGWNKGAFWLGIHCSNEVPIAGFQFELPDNLQLLGIEGGSSKEAGFQLHHNNKGLILGFSMQGNKIPIRSNQMLLKLQVRVIDGDTFPIKTILASANGEKLPFINNTNMLIINKDSLNVSFYE